MKFLCKGHGSSRWQLTLEPRETQSPGCATYLVSVVRYMVCLPAPELDPPIPGPLKGWLMGTP